MVSCNSTLTDANISETPLFSSVTFHRLGLAISAVFSLISAIIAFFLIFKHATHYSKPAEQKHIIRIILMLPIYSCVSFLSYLYYHNDVYFEVMRDCYEAFAIASFFTLLCQYVAPNLHEQKEYFRQLTPKNWFWAVFGLQKCTGGQDKGILRRPRSGLTWFNVIWIGVFQYCFVRVLFTIVSVISQAFGRYCEDSMNPAFAHIWVECIEGLAVTFAMFFLIQFYIQLKDDLAEHKPFLKVLSIKLVIFFSFWQSLVISFLSSTGVLKTSKKLAAVDVKLGMPSMLLCIEMAIFAVMHLFAFPWREYDLTRATDPLTAPGSGYSGTKPEYQGGWLGVKAIGDALNPWDMIKASARGFRWLFVRRKHRFHDISYQPGTIGAKLDEPQTSIPGPRVTSDSPPPDTELQVNSHGRTGILQHYDDRAGLLSHAQGTAGVDPSLGRHGSYDDRSLDHEHMETPMDLEADGVGMTHNGLVAFPEASTYGGNYSNAVPTYPAHHLPPASLQPAGVPEWHTDTGYHAAPTAPSSALSNPQLRHMYDEESIASPASPYQQMNPYSPAESRAGQGHTLPHFQPGHGHGNPEWDHWSDARRE